MGAAPEWLNTTVSTVLALAALAAIVWRVTKPHATRFVTQVIVEAQIPLADRVSRLEGRVDTLERGAVVDELLATRQATEDYRERSGT